jgi:hypothetical protein
LHSPELQVQDAIKAVYKGLPSGSNPAKEAIQRRVYEHFMQTLFYDRGDQRDVRATRLPFL